MRSTQQLLSYRDMVRELALTDLKLKYQGSLLGYAWTLLRPLLLFAILYVVFTRVISVGDAVPHYAAQLLLAIVLWSYFAESTAVGMVSIIDRGEVIRRASFPRIAIPIGASIASAVALLLNVIVLVGFVALSGVPMRPQLPLLAPILVELYLFSVGTSLWLAALFVRFRDLRHIWDLALQVLFYASPVIYPLSLVPAGIAWLPALNPLAQIITDARKAMIEPSSVSSVDILPFPFALVPYLVPVLIVIGGYLYFESAASRFAEEL